MESTKDPSNTCLELQEKRECCMDENGSLCETKMNDGQGLFSNESQDETQNEFEGGGEKNLPSQESSGTKSSYAPFDQLMAQIQKEVSPENKISHSLLFMESSLSHGNSLSFKYFWEVRKGCLEFFKSQDLPFAVRSHLWDKYIELTKEAHRLKTVFDEQSAFAAEQIDLAIGALEKEIDSLSNTLKNAADPDLGTSSIFVKGELPRYLNWQKELNFLNAFATRVNALRKELIKTEMRIRFKNKFFQRLSQAGDRIFPRRKELIKEVSQVFSRDIEQIIETHFKEGAFTHPFYVLRDEVKALQTLAKSLTLNTQAFNLTRKSLSECWDRIKKFEKEKKKEKAEVKSAFKENGNLVEEKIKEVESRLSQESASAEPINDKEALSLVEEVSQFMKNIQLDRDDVKAFRSRLSLLKSSITDKIEAVEKEKRVRVREAEKQRQGEITAALQNLSSLKETLGSLKVDQVETKIGEIRSTFEAQGPTKTESFEFDRLIRSLQDALALKKIDNLPADDKAAYGELQKLLKSCQARKKEIRDQLEDYRKSAGSTGLDIEQAFKRQEVIEHEKGRLAQVESEISSIESKLKLLSKTL